MVTLCCFCVPLSFPEREVTGLVVTAGKAARSIKLVMMNDRAAADTAESILNYARLLCSGLVRDRVSSCSLGEERKVGLSLVGVLRIPQKIPTDPKCGFAAKWPLK